MSCRESENLYLSDEVLGKIGIDWTKAQETITERADEFGQKSKQLKSLISQDRKEIDLKGLMEELTQILDPKKVDWRIRIAQVIGDQKPEGQLKDFLGEEIISTLWE